MGAALEARPAGGLHEQGQRLHGGEVTGRGARLPDEGHPPPLADRYHPPTVQQGGEEPVEGRIAGLVVPDRVPQLPPPFEPRCVTRVVEALLGGGQRFA